jgi:gamma-glutamyltranspeptidase / glutathione hydrolase
MMVALTQTLLSRFGAKLLLPETGVLMNNGMMWFDPRPGHPNSIAPGKRPLANMCPVVVSREGRPWLALGASGGRSIMPAVAQILAFLIDHGMNLEAAFHQPRLDESGGGTVTLDARLPPEVAAAVAAEGQPVERGETSAYPVLFASPSAVMREGGRNIGMAEIASPWSGAVAEQAQ